MKVLSLYCGAGGLDSGLTQTNIQITTAIDYNVDCCNTYKLNNPDTEIICGKVSDFESTFSKYDIIIGGVPCQPFTRAKIKTRTFDATEVDLFWKIVDNLKPTYYLMENVKDVIKICSRQSVLINCADYGTPQLRQRRIFSNISTPKPTHLNHVSIKEAIGFDGIVEDRKSTFGEKYGISGGKFRTRSSERPCYTITTDYRMWLIKNGIERKATEEEVAVLQGFPKGYKFYGNKKSVKTQIGNALPSQPIKAMFEQIMLEPIKNRRLN